MPILLLAVSAGLVTSPLAATPALRRVCLPKMEAGYHGVGNSLVGSNAQEREAQPAPTQSKPAMSLQQKVAALRAQMEISKDLPLIEAVDQVAKELGVVQEGATLAHKVDACLEIMGPAASTHAEHAYTSYQCTHAGSRTLDWHCPISLLTNPAFGPLRGQT